MSSARGRAGAAARGTERQAMGEIDAAILSTLFSQAPIGLYVLDSDLRLVRFNPAARRSGDFALDGLVGEPLARLLSVFGVDDRAGAERMVREVLETGRPALGERFTARAGTPPVQSVHSGACFRLHDPDGAVLGLVVAVADVTDRSESEARLRLLDAAHASIGSTLDVYQTAADLCDVCVPQLADSVSVDVLDSLLCGEAPAPGSSLRGRPLRRAGFRSAGTVRGVPAVGEGVSYPYDTPYDRVLTTLRPQLVSELDQGAEWLMRDLRGKRLREAGVHSVMAVPLSARGVVLGLASFYRWRNPGQFDATDLDLAEQIASTAAVCLDNARLYTRERSVARLLGTGRRPVEESVRTAVATSHAYLPTGAGGAWFDVIALSGSRVALVVGDSTGLGTRAAVAMADLRAGSAALSGLDLPPDEILERLHAQASEANQQVASAAVGDENDPAGVAASRETCLYVVYDPATRVCSAASAGHPGPSIAYADGRVERLEVPQGPPLGQGIAQYSASDQVLPEGAVLILHNGVLLQRGGEDKLARLSRLLRGVAEPEAALHEFCDALVAEAAPGSLERDAVVLLARTRALQDSQTAAWTLPDTPEAVGQARKLAAAQLERWGIQGLCDSTELIVSELVTNAVRYADGGPIGLRLIRDRTLSCEVTDGSDTAPRLRRANDSDEGGRGLFITEQLTQRWGARPNRRGKTIWAEQALVDQSALDDVMRSP